jgi:cell division protein FtsQ
MRETMRAIVTVLTGGLALAGGAVLFARSDLLRLRTVTVTAGAHVSEAHVRHLADLRDGASLLTLDLDAAATGIRRHPWVADVSLRRVLPDRVDVVVTERTPAAVLVLEELWLVDAEGVVIHRALPDELGFPYLTGLSPKLATAQPELARRIVRDALAILQKSEGHAGLQSPLFSEVRFDARSGYTLALENGGEVILGFRPIEEPLAQLDALAQNGVYLAGAPLRVDLGVATQAIVSPL